MRTRVADKHRSCRLLGTIAARRGAAQDDTAASARRAGRAVTDRHTAAPPRLERSSGTLPPGIRPATHEPATLSSRDHTAHVFAPLFVHHCLNRFMQHRRDHASVPTSHFVSVHFGIMIKIHSMWIAIWLYESMWMANYSLHLSESYEHRAVVDICVHLFFLHYRENHWVCHLYSM